MYKPYCDMPLVPAYIKIFTRKSNYSQLIQTKMLWIKSFLFPAKSLLFRTKNLRIFSDTFSDEKMLILNLSDKKFAIHKIFCKKKVWINRYFFVRKRLQIVNFRKKSYKAHLFPKAKKLRFVTFSYYVFTAFLFCSTTNSIINGTSNFFKSIVYLPLS